ncbi:hypothetical protein PM082_019337 [Marasmius tenuissimus]|nr:hypothetical protein PM082_019337 [Marasmius tenuissimus]
MLQERREDPVVILAVHMQALSYARYSPVQPPSWASWNRNVCKEEMDEFLESQEVRR